MGLNCIKPTKATTSRQFTFYHSVPSTFWHWFSWPQKDERLRLPRSYPAVLNLEPLDWESSTLPLGHWSFRLTHLLFIYEQTLFNFSNIRLEQQIYFLHNPFFIHPAIQNTTLLFKQLSKINNCGCLILLAQKNLAK